MSLAAPLSTCSAEPGPMADSYPLTHLLQQEQSRVDIFAHGIVKDESSCLELKNHIMRHGKVKAVDISDCTISPNGWNCLLESFSGVFIGELVSLNVNQTQLSSESCIYLLRELRQHAPKLEKLSISGNNLGDEIQEELLEWIPKNLRCLDISYNSFKSRCITKILDKLTQVAPRLETLSLSGIRLDFSNTTALGRLLAQAQWLTTLKLSGCHIDDASADPIAAVLRTSSLEVIDFSHNSVIGALSYQDGPAMVTFPPTTTVVNLNGNYIHASQINGLVQCMGEVTSTLKELSLGHTLDGDDNLQLFFSLLRDMPQLKKLDISDCRLTYRSGKYIAQVLRFFPALEDLNVSANLLDVEGANDVSVSLEWMKHLKNLNISAAHIGNCGAVSIVTGLLRSTSPVEVLDLSHNDITDVGVREVCTCLSRLTSPKLYYLNLSHNPFAGLSATQLKSMMAERQTNCVVDATDTPLEEVSRESSKGRQTPDTSET